MTDTDFKDRKEGGKTNIDTTNVMTFENGHLASSLPSEVNTFSTDTNDVQKDIC